MDRKTNQQTNLGCSIIVSGWAESRSESTKRGGGKTSELLYMQRASMQIEMNSALRSFYSRSVVRFNT